MNSRVTSITSIDDVAETAPATVTDVHTWPFGENLTEAEGRMIEAQRRWTRADEDPALRRRLLGFDTLQVQVSAYFDGWFDREEAASCFGDEYADRLLAGVQMGQLYYFG